MGYRELVNSFSTFCSLPLLTWILFCAPVIGYGLLTRAEPKSAQDVPPLPVDLLPPPASANNFSLSLDFLYWKADEDGLEYGTKMIATPLIGKESETKTKLLDLHFDWDPGLRLGVAYTIPQEDDWTLKLNWTHMRNFASNKSSAQGIESQTGDVNTIISPWVNLLFELRSGAKHASAHWKLDYNTLDLELGKTVFLSKTFELGPFFGLRDASLDQDYDVKYKSLFILAEGAPAFTRTVSFKAKNDFHAFGLRTGTELLFKFHEHWHLFSHVAGNLLYGKFKVRMKNLNDQGLGEGSISPMPLDFFAAENLWRGRLSFEEAIGLSWQSTRLRLRFAYELSQWINQNELFYTFYFRGQDAVSTVPIRNQGNLSFQGIRLGLQYDF